MNFSTDIDFHLVKQGTSAPRSMSSFSDSGTPIPTAVVVPVQTTDALPSVAKACGLVTSAVAAPITSHSSDSMPHDTESDVFKENTHQSLGSQTSKEHSPGEHALSYISPRCSVISHHSNSLTTNNHAPNDSSVYTRSSSVPPIAKSVHSDVYSTMFALHSLGNSNVSNYMTKVRGILDVRHQPSRGPSVSSGQINTLGRSDRVSKANKRCSLQPGQVKVHFYLYT